MKRRIRKLFVYIVVLTFICSSAGAGSVFADEPVPVNDTDKNLSLDDPSDLAGTDHDLSGVPAGDLSMDEGSGSDEDAGTEGGSNESSGTEGGEGGETTENAEETEGNTEETAENTETATEETENKEKEKEGYTPSIENAYCMRCFRLKHYDERKEEKRMPNEEIIKRVNQSDGFVFFLVDFLNINLETIRLFKQLELPKVFLLCFFAY